MSNGVEFIALAVAAENAEKIKLLEAQAFVKGFNHDSASIADRIRYAECVRLLYPSEKVELSDRIGVGILALLFIIGGVVGYFTPEYDYERWLGGFAGLIITFVCLLCIAVFAGVTQYVFERYWLTGVVIVLVLCFELFAIGNFLKIPEKIQAWRKEGTICEYTRNEYNLYTYRGKCR